MHSNLGLHAELCTYCKAPLDPEENDIRINFAGFGHYKFCSDSCKEDWEDDIGDGSND
jgi:hypothetical protein